MGLNLFVVRSKERKGEREKSERRDNFIYLTAPPAIRISKPLLVNRSEMKVISGLRIELNQRVHYLYAAILGHPEYCSNPFKSP